MPEFVWLDVTASILEDFLGTVAVVLAWVPWRNVRCCMVAFSGAMAVACFWEISDKQIFVVLISGVWPWWQN